MSKTSPESTHSPAKRLALIAASAIAAGIVLAFPQTQQALPMSSPPLRTAQMLLGAAAHYLPDPNDYWHTVGNQILDRQNRPVRIKGVNWSGFETKEAVPGGLEAQDYRTILNTIKKNGFNTVRIPLSNEMVEFPTVPSQISFRNAAGPINEDLRDLTSMQILDKIVTSAGRIGLKVILDNHRSEAGSSAEENGLWYTTQFSESAWIEDWASLARRFEGQSAVIGMDLRNEPHNAQQGGACWDCGGSHDWHLAAERAGNVVLAINPRLLIFVEGVDTYGDDTSWWGGNLEGVGKSPVHLSVPGRLVYSVHEYGPIEYNQGWFNTSTNSETLISLWRRRWAFVSETGIAPVWIGEFGTTDVQSSLSGSEGQWFSTLIDFLRIHPSLGWTYWGINGEDRYGLLGADYSTAQARSLKMAALASIDRRVSDASQGSDVEFEPKVKVISAEPVTYSKLSTSPHKSGLTQSLAAFSSRPDQSSADDAIRPINQPNRITELSVHGAIAADIAQAVRTANLGLGKKQESGDSYR